MPSSNSAPAACINPVSPEMGPRRWQEVKVRRHVPIGVLKGILVIGIKNVEIPQARDQDLSFHFGSRWKWRILQVDILTAEQGLHQQELFTEWETVMGHHGYLIVGQEDLNSPTVTEMQNKGVFKSETSLVPAKKQQGKRRKKRKAESGQIPRLLGCQDPSGNDTAQWSLVVNHFSHFP